MELYPHTQLCHQCLGSNNRVLQFKRVQES